MDKPTDRDELGSKVLETLGASATPLRRREVARAVSLMLERKVELKYVSRALYSLLSEGLVERIEVPREGSDPLVIWECSIGSKSLATVRALEGRRQVMSSSEDALKVLAGIM